jgi:hypothetical protein
MEEILKRIGDAINASAWRLFGLAAGLSVFASAKLYRWPLDVGDADSGTVLAIAVVSISAGIAFGAFLQAAFGAAVRVFRAVQAVWHDRAVKRRFGDRLSALSPIERQIIARLIADRRRSFEVDQSGGHAARLIAEGFFRLQLAPNQAGHMFRVPVVVPDSMWQILSERSADFEADIRALQPGSEPWHRHWMTR